MGLFFAFARDGLEIPGPPQGDRGIRAAIYPRMARFLDTHLAAP